MPKVIEGDLFVLESKKENKLKFRLIEDKVKGGKADKMSASDFDSDELSKGVKVELEHTDDKTMAKEIAMDHLVEDPHYYTNLEKVHKD